MESSHRIRGGRIIGFALFSVLLIAATFLAPQSWLDSFSGFFGATQPQADAFSGAAEALDAALDAESAVSLVATEFDRLAPHVGVRRALRAGPMTEEEVRRATRILTRGLDDLATAKTEEERRAIVLRVHTRIMEACPRLDAARLTEELETFREQLARRQKSPAGGMAADAECATCHAQTQPLPEGRQFDAIGIYPFMGTHPALADGRNLPVLVESLELATLPATEATPDCLGCHAPHGSPDFEIEHPHRVENQGLWVNIMPGEPGVFHVQVKTKNQGSAHRAPAGLPNAAYVVTVEAFDGDTRLGLRYGTRLPTHLRRTDLEAGVAFARHMVDAAGIVTTDLSRVVDLESDTRLAPGRFAEDHFVFDRATTGPVRTVVTLWYFPDYATWDGAVPVRRADEAE